MPEKRTISLGKRDFNYMIGVSKQWNLRFHQVECVVIRFDGSNYDISTLRVDGRYHLDSVYLEVVDLLFC